MAPVLLEPLIDPKHGNCDLYSPTAHCCDHVAESCRPKLKQVYFVGTVQCLIENFHGGIGKEEEKQQKESVKAYSKWA